MIHQAPGPPGETPGHWYAVPCREVLVSHERVFSSCNAPLNAAGAGNTGEKAACRFFMTSGIRHFCDGNVRPQIPGKSRNDGGKDD